MKKLLFVLGVMVFVVASASVAQAALYDWTGITPIYTDAQGEVVNPDWDVVDAYIANDGNYLYLRMDVAGVIATNTQYMFLIDANNNTADGYTGYYENWQLGADYRILQDQWGSVLQEHTGAQNSDTWVWPTPLTAESSVAGNTVEWKVALADMSLSAGDTIKLVGTCYGDLSGWGYYDWPGLGTQDTPITYAVPEPSSLLLLGSGFLGLMSFIRKKKK